ncbi:MAG: PTS sugar transporter subunit IIA [Candidatus Njordarchaeia archaeon]
MIGLVIITHHEMSKALIKVVRMLSGEIENVEAVSLIEGEGLEDLKEKAMKAIQKVDNGDGVLVLVDLFGGTTMNVSALIAAERDDVEIVSGVNVPMLLSVALERDDVEGVKELAKIALESGKEGIVDVRERIVSKMKRNQTT